MPGVNLNLSLPSLSDTMSTAISKIATALSAIQDDLTPQIIPSEININASLSMNGNALTNVGSVQLLSGNAPTAAGSFYYSNGEFYLRDASGVIQVTQGGALMVTSTGGIVGDYGQPGITAVATYDNASQEFRFFADTGVYADLVADDLVLNGSAGSVRFGVDAAITTARQFIIKSLPTSGVSALVYNAATSSVEDNAVTRVTNTFKATTLDVSGNATFAAEMFHGERTILAPLDNAVAIVNTYSIMAEDGTGQLYWATSSGGEVHIGLWGKGLRTGDRITKIELHYSLATPTVQYMISTFGVGSSTPAQTSSFTSSIVTINITSPTALTDTGAPFLRVLGGVSRLYGAVIHFDRA